MIITRHPSGTNDWVVWQHPVSIIQTTELADVLTCLNRIEEQVQTGLMALGFITYEAGRAFDARFASKSGTGSLPLVWFALFDTCEPFNPPLANHPKNVRWKPSVNHRTYGHAIRAIKKRIAAGDTYQVNYTFPLVASEPVDTRDLFFQLAESQPTPYAMLIETAEFHVASASPELFFQLDGTSIRVEPMKGTCPRGPHPELDKAIGEALCASEKNRAENIMIVDMMRNDLGRIATPGSITVDELFKVTPWPTLWQMTSTISARTTARVPDIFSALFPCASITGAPKLKTSEIIAELEPAPRGLYTGTIGWWFPGQKARFAVAIRTMVQNRLTGDTRYGIGSGIVWDSLPDDEYRECLLKSRILHHDTKSFRLLETMRWDPATGYVLRNEHLTRMAGSAAFFGIPFDMNRAISSMEKKVKTFGAQPQRVRILVRRNGVISIQATPLTQPGHYTDPSNAPIMTGTIDAVRINPDSPFLYHKTTRRNTYQQARKRNPDGDEVLLINTRGELMEFTSGNMVLRRGNDWLTPELASGILPGIFRQHLIEMNVICPARIMIADLTPTDEVYFINSVRGWRKVNVKNAPTALFVS